MSLNKYLFRLLSLGLAIFVAGDCLAGTDEPDEAEGRSYVFLLAGDWQRQLVEFYIKRIDEQLVPPLSQDQKERIRVLLHDEADALDKIQMENYNDLGYAIYYVIKLADETHKKLGSILSDEQHYIIPGIVERRKEMLQDRMDLWLDGLWYKVENTDIEDD